MKVVWRDTSKDFPLTIGTMTFAPEDEMSVDYKYISRTESHWDLTIKNVKPHHAGLYECQITSSTLFTHYVRLNVIDEPESSVKISEVRVTGGEYVTLHEKIHLTCNATGADRAPDDVDWFFEGNRIHSSSPRWRDRVEILKRKPIPGKAYISELIIRRSTMADQGSYVCRSSDLSVNSIKVHVLNESSRRQQKNPSICLFTNAKSSQTSKCPTTKAIEYTQGKDIVHGKHTEPAKFSTILDNNRATEEPSRPPKSSSRNLYNWRNKISYIYHTFVLP
ncbi:hypothetical protein CHS0354_010478 [Potamilus streckersoni]|uniref:Ig-like domain-containing protein n=1 Tax=Potamilus streckersoni TaxID=2493646 RepID=A0AAE0RRG6_9BIVA|nr:hypothetical protein CHS0354_010478 [Potamilus streckersoni]